MNVNQLLATIEGRKGLAKGNLYRVTIGSESGLSVLCDSVALPGRQIQTADHAFLVQSIKVPTTYIVDDCTLVFKLTNDFYVKKYFEAWHDSVFDRQTNSVKFRDKYLRDITIETLDSSEKATYAVRLFGAYPTTINAIELSGTSQNEVLQLTVVLTYIDYSPGTPISK